MQIGEYIRRAAHMFGEAPALTEGERTLNFRDLDAATDRLGNALLAQGFVPGDRVGVLLPNGIDCLVAYYALAKSGLVRVSLNVRETNTDHSYKLAESGARGLIHDGSGGAAGFDVELSYDLDALRRLIERGPADPCRVNRDLDAPYRLGFTGGTTGAPKAVTLTTLGETAELSAFLMDLVPDLAPGERFLHAAPIAHASGAFFLPSLVRGVRQLIMPHFDAAGFIAMAAQARATHTFLVPTMLAMIMEEPALQTVDLHFKRICYGASPIAPSLLERAMACFGSVFAQTYGQAESPMVITYLGPEDHDRVGSCGRPYTTVDVAIFDDDDSPVPTVERCEIVCRGTQLMARYWNRPEETARAFRNGWLHTGDIGRMDEDGFVYILDRKNDMLISGGYNVYPREIEDVLLAHEGVVEAAVVGLPDEKWGDRVHAVIAGRPGLDPETVRQFCRERLAGYKCPKSVEIWDALPKSGAGKLLRRAVRDRVIAPADETPERQSA